MTLIFENRSARFHVKASTFSLGAPDVAFVRGMLNGIVNFSALTFGPAIINALWSVRARTVFAAAAVITWTVQTARL